jgi:hypothetical protein
MNQYARAAVPARGLAASLLLMVTIVRHASMDQDLEASTRRTSAEPLSEPIRSRAYPRALPGRRGAARPARARRGDGDGRRVRAWGGRRRAHLGALPALLDRHRPPGVGAGAPRAPEVPAAAAGLGPVEAAPHAAPGRPAFTGLNADGRRPTPAQSADVGGVVRVFRQC